VTRTGLWRCGTGIVVVAAVTWPLGASPASAAECPNDAVRSSVERVLPDCRAYEQASPPDKNGSDVGINGEQVPSFVASADGSAVAFETLGVLPGAQSATLPNENLSRRGSSGWSTQPIGPPLYAGPDFGVVSFQFFTANLRQAVLRTPAGPSLRPDDTGGAANFYLRDNDDGSYRTLSVLPPSGQRAPALVSYQFAGASDDLRHILFESDDALTPDAPPISPVPHHNLYEWVDGQVRLAAILPDGTPAPLGGEAGSLGGASALTRSIVHAISVDGSRIVFGTPSETVPDGSQIYVREDGQRTLEASASRRTVPDLSAPSPPIFWGATADGSQVFFTSTTALTNDAAVGSASLYRFDVAANTLTDLTVNSNPASPDAVAVEGVVGISDDGSYIYFRDPGQYLPGQGVAGQSNLYLWHDGAIRFVASDGVGSPDVFEANNKTSRVTPDGRHLIFASASPLTGYDNTDAATGAADSEVFLYDADSNALTCVSCRPDGERPQGSATLPFAPVRALRNPQRGVTDDGSRVFFDTVDALVPSDVNGKQDVYEYEAGGVHLISTGASANDSFFASASASGDDVFFVTREQLAAADVDENLDIYDARVDGGFPEPVSPQPCSGDGCQGAPTPAPGRSSPASSSVAGTGNAPPGPSARPSFRVATLSASARQRAARTGFLTLSVRVSEGGILKARATRRAGSRSTTVASATAHVPRASTVSLRLRLAKSVRTALAHRTTVRLAVRVSFSRVRSPKNASLDLQR
jgi:Tol biopolymer transport system component